MRLIVNSGGQAGVDRGALLAALDAHVEYSGWVPKGGRCEDRVMLLAGFPELKETESSEYPKRTELNVRDTDATIIVTPNGRLDSPGSRLTGRWCERLGKPYRVCIPSRLADCLLVLLRNWHQPVLRVNIAGTRESRCPGLQMTVYHAVLDTLTQARRLGLLEWHAESVEQSPVPKVGEGNVVDSDPTNGGTVDQPTLF
ncbi:putative molybdenum carrier protein [Bifidobacterium sp. SO1]|uniref:YpsA SLOG family protein n=1 Tax=Bifidobacterium sp. SO1 TaxID=2809029 RepID=UPI001BDBB755|nr:putative molybdenum carrier protein [Bifidobacterium sp. SO1]MBT1162573.1 hypothetical protein [Bifidobacterium sp. SO1]